MAIRRIPMRHIREILRLHHERHLSTRTVKRNLKMALAQVW